MEDVKRDIIVVGASAGGVPALQDLVRALPDDLPAAVLIVLHRSPDLPDLMPQILRRAGPLPVKDVADGEPPQRGHIYIAPPDRHLLVEKGILRVVRGPKENFSRPAIDPLFRSAAQEYGPRVAGVILSGTLYDGTAGLWFVKRHGGVTLVQQPDEALFSDMVENALDHVRVDFVLRIRDIAAVLTHLARGTEVSPALKEGTELGESVKQPGEVIIEMSGETTEFEQLPDIVGKNRAEQISGKRHGMTTIFTCPECGGTLWQANAGSVIQFRCHVGHSYTGEVLAQKSDETLEQALWYAIRLLVDKSILLRQLAENARDYGNTPVHNRYEQAAQLAEQHAETLKRVVQSPE